MKIFRNDRGFNLRYSLQAVKRDFFNLINLLLALGLFLYGYLFLTAVNPVLTYWFIGFSLIFGFAFSKMLQIGTDAHVNPATTMGSSFEPIGDPNFLELVNGFAKNLGRKYSIVSWRANRVNKSRAAMTAAEKNRGTMFGVINHLREDLLMVGEDLVSENYISNPHIVPVLAHEMGHLRQAIFVPVYALLGIVGSLNLFVSLVTIAAIFYDYRLAIILYVLRRGNIIVGAVGKRAAETAADIVGAKLTTPARMAAALNDYSKKYFKKPPYGKTGLRALNQKLVANHPDTDLRIKRLNALEGKIKPLNWFPEYGLD